MSYTPKNPNGQTTMANSSPVVVASDQSAIKVDVSGTSANAVAIKVDGSAVTQPVSGTVSVTGVATSTKQSDGSQKTQVVDGSGNVIGATSNALDVNIKSGAPTTMTVTQSTASNLKVDLSGTGANSTPIATNATTATATGDTVMQNAVSATGNGTSLNVTGYGTALLQVSGTFSATVTFEASSDAGTTWTNISATQIGGDIVLSTTAPGLFRITSAGFDLIRARVTWTSGTSVTVTGRATNAVHSGKIIKLATSSNTIGSIANTSFGTTSATVNVGQKTSNTSAQQLSASSTVPTNGILVQALSTNTASVFIGGSGVTTSNGFELQPGQAVPFTANLNTLYVIGSNATDKVCWNVQ